LEKLKEEAKELKDPAELHKNALKQQAILIELKKEEDKQSGTWFTFSGMGDGKPSTFGSEKGQIMDKSQFLPDHLHNADYKVQLAYYHDLATKAHSKFGDDIRHVFQSLMDEGQTVKAEIDDEDDVFAIFVMIGPVKTQERCKEKMSQLYEEYLKNAEKEPLPHAARVFDYLRVTVVCNSLWRLQQCFTQVLEKLKVLRVKNRLTTPGDGNKCILLNFEYSTPEGPLISEIQFTTGEVFNMNKSAHKYYESVRVSESAGAPAVLHYT